MQATADLHLHSKYSRAVSQQMTIANMAKWGDIKGIDLLGTGDFTHPLWLREIETYLAETGNGIYALKNDRSIKTRFLLTSEVSSIYSQGGKVRRIHTVLIAPSVTTVKKIINELTKRGANLMSDGRPIVGLSAIQVCELVWGADPDCIIIPAHVWTPWFSLYGSKSGFDTMKECFGEFTDRITAIETGLSSDPAMNWRIPELDNRSIISNSDAHSLTKLGREATVFRLKDNYQFCDISQALKNKTDSENKIIYTIEFYPEEGKYHYTGHRTCGIVQSPEETLKKGTICPVCGKPLTIGVMHRVEELAKENNAELINKESKIGVVGTYQANMPDRPPYISMVPLFEIIAQALDTAPTSKKVEENYHHLIADLGPELTILLKTPLEKIARAGGDKLADGVKRIRERSISVNPGYDGVFGTVKVWADMTEKTALAKEQMALFN